jgi:type I restriction enzyme R subunit
MTPPTEADTCRDYVLPKLYEAGWTDLIREQVTFTDGRVVTSGRTHVRGPRKRADYLLHVRNDFPIAVVEAKREHKKPGDGLQKAMEYAEILGLKFAYSTNGKGIVEQDYLTGKQRDLTAFPSPDELWMRLRSKMKLKESDEDVLLAAFNRELREADGRIKEPRYYQRIAIDSAVEGVLQGRRRLLLTMATGTGKTFVAVQLVWKLWKSGRRKRILYLADRNFLVQQPLTREFSIFGDAVHRIQGEAKKGREIYFALYQSIAEDASRPGLYKEYPPDFFDLIIVDECHRGSAKDESNWRSILEHFTTATQIGMTATPRCGDNVNTYRYFGNPIYTYTLADGIEDGFLAPFRVRRVVPNVDATGWSPTRDQRDRVGRLIPEGIYQTPDFERVVSLLARTEAVARHLTEFLKKTDRFAKTIVFCVDQEHAEQMRMALHNLNADLARDNPHYVARVVSDEGEVGRTHLENFQDSDKLSPVIVTTSQLLTTGVDVPTCRNVVLFKPIGSIVEFKQIIGRGTRLCPEKGKMFFTIIDYAGATKLFQDPEFDGAPEHLSDEEIDENGDPLPRPKESGAADPTEPFGGPKDPAQPRDKYYVVDGVRVAITAEAVFEMDPGGTTKIRTIEYSDYTADQVRTLYPSAAELKGRWTRAEQRAAVLQALESRGITPADLAERTGKPDADPLDLLIHLAWHEPLRSRRERVARLRRDSAAFFNRFSLKARQVLEDLLEKYAEHGIQELDDLNVLEVPPLSRHGTAIQIAEAFGGSDKLHEAIDELQRLVYAA